MKSSLALNIRKNFLKIGHNTAILLLVNIIGSVIGFLMAAALGRGLGDSGFGQYSFVMTWLLSLNLFTEFGLSTVLTRDLAARPRATGRYLINSLAAKTLLSLPVMLLILIFAPQIIPNQNPAMVTALRWGLLFFYSGLFYSSFTAVFKAHQIMTPILWLTLSGQIPLFAGTLILLLTRQPLAAIVVWAGVTQTGQVGLAYIFYRQLRLHPGRQSPPRSRVRLALIKTLLMRAWPFAVAGFLAALQLRANILILGYLQGDQALGWFAAASRFVETGRQLPGAFYAAILPAMAALAKTAGHSQKLQSTLRQSQWGLLGFGLLAGLGALLLARPVLTLTYGQAYQPATLTLQILTLSLIPSAQNSILIIYLYARSDERFVNWLMAAGLAVNLSLCFWLIPRWGATGTALALLIAESVLYLPYRYRVSKQQTQGPTA